MLRGLDGYTSDDANQHIAKAPGWTPTIAEHHIISHRLSYVSAAQTTATSRCPGVPVSRTQIYVIATIIMLLLLLRVCSY